jgi:DNA-binding PadR family transcriptional regulator
MTATTYETFGQWPDFIHRHRHKRANVLAMRGGPGRHGFGPGGPGGPGGFGPTWFGPGGPRGPRGGRRRRGDARLAALLLLAEEPRNGYEVMQEIEQRSGGVWRASPGSVYPALSQLEDEGLIRSEERDGRRVFVITDAGREQLAERPDDAPAPWETANDELGDGARALWAQFKQIAVAVTQVTQAGDADQIGKAGEVLGEARRALYLILAGEAPSASE